MIRQKNKRGVSDVITTVLIILLVLAAVAIIGGILLRNIGEAGSKIGTQTACLDLDVKVVDCNKNAATTVDVFVNRGGRGNDAELSALTLLFEDASGVVTTISTSVLNDFSLPTSFNKNTLPALATVKFTTTKAGALSASKVKSAVTVKGSDGKEVICEPSLVEVTCTQV